MMTSRRSNLVYKLASITFTLSTPVSNYRFVTIKKRLTLLQTSTPKQAWGRQLSGAPRHTDRCIRRCRCHRHSPERIRTARCGSPTGRTRRPWSCDRGSSDCDRLRFPVTAESLSGHSSIYSQRPRIAIAQRASQQFYINIKTCFVLTIDNSVWNTARDHYLAGSRLSQSTPVSVPTW